MLVLTRRREQAIMIGHEVEITVVDIRGDKVRLGIRAPDSINVHRREVYDAIQKANEDSAKLQPHDIDASIKPAAPLAIQKPLNAPAPLRPDPFLPDRFILAAIEEARIGLSEGGLPIGSVLVRGDQIIGRGHDRRVQKGDRLAYAEIDCFASAGRQKTYKDTVLYSTLMPCYLCSGAAVQFGVSKVIVGESIHLPNDWRRETGGETSLAFMRSHGIDVTDLHDAQCIEMLDAFIRDHPGFWNEEAAED